MSTTRKPTIPTTLPRSTHDPALFSLTPPLRDSITASLGASPSSIHSIRSALSSSLADSGWMEQLNDYVLELFRKEPNLREEEVLERVVEAVRRGLRESAQRRREDGGEGTMDEGGKSDREDGGLRSRATKLAAPTRKAIDEGVRAVKRELEVKCQVEDEDEWE